MHRREFSTLFLGSAVAAGLSGCISNRESPYTEQVSNVLISADEKKLVVMTGKFHYIFDAPSALVETLKEEFHPYVHASISGFHVSSNGHTHGQIDLKISNAPKEVLGAAIRAGYTQAGDEAICTIVLDGQRFRAGNVSMPAKYNLNQTYSILVTSEQVESHTPLTPIQIVAFVPVLAGITLFAVFILFNCAIHGAKDCHE